jgi:prepilin-type processing-associated H-X9-DG protein
MGLMMPALGKARQSARRVVCLTNLRRLAIAGYMYAEDQGAFPPHRLKKGRPGDEQNYINQYGRDRPRWPWFFDQEVGPVIDPGPWIAGSGDTFGDDDTLLMTNDYFICPSFNHPSFDVHDIRNGSYGYNYQYLGSPRLRTDGRYQNYPVKLIQVKKPSHTVMLADGRGNRHPHGEHAYKLDPPRLARSTGAVYFGDWKKPTLQEQHTPAEGRHSDLANVSFVDGHTETMTLEAMGYVRDEQGIIIADYPGGSNRLWSHTKMLESETSTK